MNDLDLCEVVITAPDPEWLKDLSRQLIEDGICASAHNFAPIRSIYRWHGEVHERTEGRVSLHTRQSRVSEIVARTKQEHPYEVPSISTRPITGGNPDYLAWIAKAGFPSNRGDFGCGDHGQGGLGLPRPRQAWGRLGPARFSCSQGPQGSPGSRAARRAVARRAMRSTLEAGVAAPYP